MTQVVQQLLSYLWGEGIDTSDLEPDPLRGTQPTGAYALERDAEFRGLMDVLAARYRNSSADLALLGQAIHRVQRHLGAAGGP